MKKFTLLLFAIILGLPFMATADSRVNLTPTPMRMTVGEGTLVLPESFTISTGQLPDSLSNEAVKFAKHFAGVTGYTVDGKASKLSDYVGKGKYVLADFWASWCGPCKREIPNLIELQKQFGGEKFVVLGVNVWDQEDKFKEALKEEGITYPQIYVPRDGKVNATELYGIQGIPQIMLFGPDGTIVKRNLRGEEMKAFVADQLK